ncbi:unnamed protein product [Arabis nemorensis]|uniref:Uncharacterized protein n=1 Tax=Arabis nemorensis TaxID=586526 RepID=A0A565CQE8_9BRAS|nr:unnamed protein product [Arabis nemorensis]
MDSDLDLSRNGFSVYVMLARLSLYHRLITMVKCNQLKSKNELNVEAFSDSKFKMGIFLEKGLSGVLSLLISAVRLNQSLLSLVGNLSLTLVLSHF